MKIDNVFMSKKTKTVLTCLNIASFAATVYLACKATKKSIENVEEMKEYADPTKKDIVKACWKNYIPATITGVLTVSSTIGLNMVSNKREASLIGSYTLLKNMYSKYKKSVNEIISEEEKKEILNHSAASNDLYTKYVKTKTPKIHNNGEKCLFYDTFSDRYFESTIADVIAAEYETNKTLVLDGCVSLNDYYMYLDVDSQDGADTICWDADAMSEMNDDIWINFDNIETEVDGNKCYAITALPEPLTLYERYFSTDDLR